MNILNFFKKNKRKLEVYNYDQAVAIAKGYEIKKAIDILHKEIFERKNTAEKIFRILHENAQQEMESGQSLDWSQFKNEIKQLESTMMGLDIINRFGDDISKDLTPLLNQAAEAIEALNNSFEEKQHQ